VVLPLPALKQNRREVLTRDTLLPRGFLPVVNHNCSFQLPRAKFVTHFSKEQVYVKSWRRHFRPNATQRRRLTRPTLRWATLSSTCGWKEGLEKLILLN
jgi:hypothetical protein